MKLTKLEFLNALKKFDLQNKGVSAKQFATHLEGVNLSHSCKEITRTRVRLEDYANKGLVIRREGRSFGRKSVKYFSNVDNLQNKPELSNFDQSVIAAIKHVTELLKAQGIDLSNVIDPIVDSQPDVDDNFLQKCQSWLKVSKLA